MIIINNLIHFWKLKYYGIIAGYRHSNLENKMDMLLKPLALSEGNMVGKEDLCFGQQSNEPTGNVHASKINIK